jgi:hypothetical protein
MSDSNSHNTEDHNIFPGEEAFPTADVPFDETEVLDAETEEIVEDTRDDIEDTLEPSNVTGITVANTLMSIAKENGAEKIAQSVIEEKAAQALAALAIREIRGSKAKQGLIEEWEDTVYNVDGGKEFLTGNSLFVRGATELVKNIDPTRQVRKAAGGLYSKAKINLIDRGLLSKSWVSLADMSELEKRILVQTGVLRIDEHLARKGDAQAAKIVQYAGMALATANPKVASTFNKILGGLVRILPRVRQIVGAEVENLSAANNNNYLENREVA